MILAVAGVLAQAPTGWSAGLAVGLFLLGLGLVVHPGQRLDPGRESVPLAERAGAQGAADLVMGLAAGGGGALAGLVVGQLGYSVLGACAAVLAAIVALASLLIRVEPPRRRGSPSELVTARHRPARHCCLTGRATRLVSLLG